MFAPKNILAPTDFSEYSAQAFKKALDIAKSHNSRIFLLHIIDGTIQQFVTDYCLDGKIVERVVNESIITSNEKIQKVIVRFPGSKEVKIITDVRRGVPSEEILKTQKEEEIDLIVIASRGRTGLKKLLIGSVTEKVMRGAACHVLLVKS
jgi:universal stress protein A